MKKEGLAILLVVITLLGVDFTANAAGTEEQSKPVTITWRMGNWWKDVMPGIIEKFQQEYPNIKVIAEDAPYVGYLEKAMTSVVGQTPPDVLAMPTNFMPPLAAKGLLDDLAPYVGKSDRIKQADFFPGAWNISFYKGVMYILHYRGEPTCLYYNQGMFQEAGLDPEKPPTTHAQLLEFAKKLTVPGKRYGFSYPAAARNAPHVTTWISVPIWAHGGDILNKEWTKSVLNQPGAVAGVQWQADLFLKHKVVPEAIMSYDGNDNGRLFGAETIAMYYAGSWGHGNIKETAKPGLKYKVASVPPDKVVFYDGWGYTIPKNSKNKDAAWKFVEWFCQPKNLVAITIRTPTVKVALDDPKWATEVNKPFFENAAYGRGLPLVPSLGEIYTLVTDAFQAVLLNKMSTQEAMDKVSVEIDKILK